MSRQASQPVRKYSERSMPHLKDFYLNQNQIGDAGAEKIASALPSIPNLKEHM